MNIDTWTNSEKRLARELFETAASAEEAELLAKFKSKAASVESMEQAWAMASELERSRREFQSKYDYRYSQLLLVFGRLVREGRIRREELDRLSAEKLAVIDSVSSF
jgi:hypothetical protein